MMGVDLTVMKFDGVENTPSVTDIVCRPTVLSVNLFPAKELSLPIKLQGAENVYGRTARGSVLVKYTVPL
jgi:hypothetical protein